jgi:drug/metabolite transporter (DMT)-like permease
VIYGLVGVAAVQVAYFNAVARLPVGVAILLTYLAIVFIVAWLWARHGRRPTLLTMAGMLIGAAALGAVGAVGLLPLQVSGRAVALFGGLVSWAVLLLGLGVLATAIPYVAGIASTRRLGPTLASFVSLAEVPFAVGAAWALLAQVPTNPSSSAACSSWLALSSSASTRRDRDDLAATTRPGGRPALGRRARRSRTCPGPGAPARSARTLRCPR